MQVMIHAKDRAQFLHTTGAQFVLLIVADFFKHLPGPPQSFAFLSFTFRSSPGKLGMAYVSTHSSDSPRELKCELSPRTKDEVHTSRIALLHDAFEKSYETTFIESPGELYCTQTFFLYSPPQLDI